jgi:para-aminobenzoate synthetase component 1
MYPLIHEAPTEQTPESLLELLRGEPGLVLLRSAPSGLAQARYSFVAARPFLTFRSFGSRCEIWLDPTGNDRQVQFGNPWRLLESLAARYELLDQPDYPFPLGGCFGYWGYELRTFVEPRLRRHAADDLELPDCHVGFYDNLVAFDHHLGKAFIISTGLFPDGSCHRQRAEEKIAFWRERLEAEPEPGAKSEIRNPKSETNPKFKAAMTKTPAREARVLSLGNSDFEFVSDFGFRISDFCRSDAAIWSNLQKAEFIERVQRAQSYIRSGDIYQVNLAQRLSADCPFSGPDLFLQLRAASPAPFSAYLDCGEFQIASSSPELFLRMSGRHVLTRPIKGTRPRAADRTRDAQLSYELQTSPKEMAELVMITDLLRNDLGRVCEFGSVEVPELVRLERYPQVQHLVSTVEGRLRGEMTHLGAFASCFPGGSVTGAPKVRAMQIIDELEPTARGPYTGALGYLGFNRESQLSIIIRNAICRGSRAFFHVGAGIVADSVPEAEYEETLAKAKGFAAALQLCEEPGVKTRSPNSTPR